MAEFQEVARQYIRMCDSCGPTCNGCPIEPRIINVNKCRARLLKNPSKYENTIMAWAAEHPEPVYPTWVEWLIREGVIPEKNGGMLATAHDPDTKKIIAARIDITPSALQPIPADTAEKLGIEPKEG